MKEDDTFWVWQRWKPQRGMITRRWHRVRKFKTREAAEHCMERMQRRREAPWREVRVSAGSPNGAG